MRYGKPDRVPYLEEGLRDDVLERWHAQGLPQDADLAQLFHLDARERIPANFGPMPGVQRWPTCMAEVEALRPHFNPDTPGRLPADWDDRVAAWRTREHILEMPLHQGLFLSLGVNDWARLEEMLYQIMDAPEVVRGILELYGDLVSGLAERILRDVQVEFATFSEPIGGNDRPLVSPQVYEDVVLPGYARIVETLRRNGVGTIVFLTYANARVLLPAVVRAGFNCLWACETEAGAMDYREIRREFGRDLRLIGGIDLDALLRGKAAIRQEMEAKLPPLLADGGYIPLADGRVRVTVPYENYVHYREMLEELTTGHVEAPRGR